MVFFLKKICMARDNYNGIPIPVTAFQYYNHKIIAKSEDKGCIRYVLVALGVGSKKENRKKRMINFKIKHNINEHEVIKIKEIQVFPQFYHLFESFKIGDEITCSFFKQFKFLDSQGISKGKGTAGTIKKFGYKRQTTTHGNSKSTRLPGSMGMCQDPGKVDKGKPGYGRMGNELKIKKNNLIVDVVESQNLIIIKGSFEGSNKNLLNFIPSLDRGNKGKINIIIKE